MPSYLQNLSNFIILILLFVFSSLVSAASTESVGKVLRVKGNVKAIDTSSRALKRGSKLFQAETIETLSGAAAQFRMIDGALFSLRENTKWQISSYKKSSIGSDNGSVKMNLLKGGLRTITGEIGRLNKKNYQLKTPLATIGIRGTHFRVELINKQLFAVVMEGVINVRASSCNENVSAQQLGIKVKSDGTCENLTKVPAIFSQKHFTVGGASQLISEDEDPLYNEGITCSADGSSTVVCIR